MSYVTASAWQAACEEAAPRDTATMRAKMAVGTKQGLRRLAQRLLSASVVISALAGCGATSSGPSALAKSTTISPAPTPCAGQSYASSAYGWVVCLPADWILDASNPNHVIIKSGKGLPMGEIGIGATDRFGGDLNKAADAYLDAWGASEADRVGIVSRVSRQRINLPSGVAAIDVTYVLGTGTQGKTRQVIVLAGDLLFILDAESYLDSWPALEHYFDRIITSFTLKR